MTKNAIVDGPAERNEPVASAILPVLPKGLADDWLFDRDLICPRCEYNLRMLRSPRCPECGTVFRWQALLHIACPRCAEPLLAVDDDACPRCALQLNWAALLAGANPARLQDYYEYSQRPVRAAAKTWLRAWRPWRFWSHIRLESPPVVSRLRQFRFWAVSIFMLGFLILRALGPLSLASPWGSGETVFLCLSIPLTLPLVTFFSLPLFTPTLARFRIRPDQLLRCLSYGCTGLGWIGFFYVLLALGTEVASLVATRWGWAGIVVRPGALLEVFAGNAEFFRITPLNSGLSLVLDIALVATAFIWWWCFLYLALRNYLRLNRVNALALFFSTQIIGLLLLFDLLMFTPKFYRRVIEVFLS